MTNTAVVEELEVSPALREELAEAERAATRFTLADAIRAGAKLVKGQLRNGWISGDSACALGAAALAVKERARG